MCSDLHVGRSRRVQGSSLSPNHRRSDLAGDVVAAGFAINDGQQVQRGCPVLVSAGELALIACMC
jgi:hypothetical protein